MERIDVMKTEEDMVLNDEVELPYMRRELVISLKALSDLEYQHAIWVRKEFPTETFYDDLEQTLDIIYSDTDLDENPDAYIDDILKNNAEARAVEKLVSKLTVIAKKYGQGLSDLEYIEKPEWQDVLASAKEAYEMIREQSPAAS